jgi:hypothetical protein
MALICWLSSKTGGTPGHVGSTDSTPANQAAAAVRFDHLVTVREYPAHSGLYLPAAHNTASVQGSMPAADKAAAAAVWADHHLMMRAMGLII